MTLGSIPLPLKPIRRQGWSNFVLRNQQSDINQSDTIAVAHRYVSETERLVFQFTLLHHGLALSHLCRKLRQGCQRL